MGEKKKHWREWKHAYPLENKQKKYWIFDAEWTIKLGSKIKKWIFCYPSWVRRGDGNKEEQWELEEKKENGLTLKGLCLLF